MSSNYEHDELVKQADAGPLHPSFMIGGASSLGAQPAPVKPAAPAVAAKPPAAMPPPVKPNVPMPLKPMNAVVAKASGLLGGKPTPVVNKFPAGAGLEPAGGAPNYSLEELLATLQKHKMPMTAPAAGRPISETALNFDDLDAIESRMELEHRFLLPDKVTERLSFPYGDYGIRMDANVPYPFKTLGDLHNHIESGLTPPEPTPAPVKAAPMATPKTASLSLRKSAADIPTMVPFFGGPGSPHARIMQTSDLLAKRKLELQSQNPDKEYQTNYPDYMDLKPPIGPAERGSGSRGEYGPEPGHTFPMFVRNRSAITLPEDAVHEYTPKQSPELPPEPGHTFGNPTLSPDVTGFQIGDMASPEALAAGGIGLLGGVGASKLLGMRPKPKAKEPVAKTSGLLNKLAFEGPVRRPLSAGQPTTNVVDMRDPESARLHDAELVNRWASDPTVKQETINGFQASSLPEGLNPMKIPYHRMAVMGAEAQGSDLPSEGFPRPEPAPSPGAKPGGMVWRDSSGSVVGSQLNDGLPEQEYLRRQYGDVNDSLRKATAGVSPPEIKMPAPVRIPSTGPKGVGSMSSTQPGNYYPGGNAAARPVAPKPVTAPVAKPMTPVPSTTPAAAKPPASPMATPKTASLSLRKSAQGPGGLGQPLNHSNPFSNPISQAVPAAGATVGNAVAGTTAGVPNAPVVPATPKPPASGGGGIMDTLKGWGDKAQGFVQNQIGGINNQFDRAKMTYGFQRMGGKSPMQAGLGAFGSLDGTTKGLAGGGIGLLGAGMLSPKSMRGWTMPLATGLGAALSTATGPDGFKFENLAKPEALMAGGLGLGAGYLGSQLLGTGDDDEEEDTDALGNPRRKERSSSMLPTLGLLGGLGLGGYGLYKYMQGSGANTPPVVPPPGAGARPTVPTDATGVGNLPAVPQQTPTPPPAALAQAPATPPVPGALAQEPIAPAAVAQAPVSLAAPGASSGSQRFADRPNEWEQFAQNNGALPGAKEELNKLVSQYQQSEIPGLAQHSKVPQLSSVYRFINDHPSHPATAGLVDRAQGYTKALDAARTATGGEWDDLSRLEGLKVTPGQPASFGIGGISSLGAFGFKDINSMASAAAQGDPKVRTAIQSLGSEGKASLLKALTNPGYTQVKDAQGQMHNLSAVSANPRAAALYGAAQSAFGEDLKPEEYDPRVFADPKQQYANTLTPGQRMQLAQDMQNPEAIDKRFGGLAPEERTLAARNLGSMFARNARGVTLPGETNPVDVNDWLDAPMQKGVARVAGNQDYSPVGLQTWRDLAARGQNSSSSLSPFRAPGQLIGQNDIMPSPAEGYSPLDIVLNRSADSDNQVLGDWSKTLTSGMNRYNPGSQHVPEQHMAPLATQLRRLSEARPDLYDKLVSQMQTNYSDPTGLRGTQNPLDWRESLAKVIDQPGLNTETGISVGQTGRRITPTWVPHR